MSKTQRSSIPCNDLKLIDDYETAHESSSLFSSVNNCSFNRELLNIGLGSLIVNRIYNRSMKKYLGLLFCSLKNFRKHSQNLNNSENLIMIRKS